MMNRMLLLLGLWVGVGTEASRLLADDAAAAMSAASLAFEKDLAERVAGPEVTVVHFWAPWCPNCRAELTPDGWAKFLNDEPGVKVIFINLWHGGQDGAPKLAAGGVGPQSNFVALTHPNPSRRAEERVNVLLGVPVSWLPSTWVYRAGKLRYAVNFGEVRFDMLRQMVKDAGEKWSH